MIKCKTSKEIGGMGHSLKRKEDARFLQGKGNYVDDIKLPGMLHMDIVRSPYAYAKIKSINAEEALKIPGVIAGCNSTFDLNDFFWLDCFPEPSFLSFPSLLFIVNYMEYLKC